MDWFQNFLLAFGFSFLGSIPPGTLNLSVLQLGLEKKNNIALRFALAAALIEYPYAWLAVEFEELIASPFILNNFKLTGALVLLTLGVFSLWSVRRPTPFIHRIQASGFRRGLVLSLLNPLVIPFWIGVTAYLRLNGWIVLSGPGEVHGYLLGVALGALTLLLLIALLSGRVTTAFEPHSKIRLVPGVVLLGLGIYAIMQYLIE
jgi:threonine/homoserine/homoserine lactone efflux protein